MRHNDSLKSRRDDGENLGKKDHENKVTKKPAPREADRESQNTPPENEVYMDLEPDELHLSDEEQPEEVSDKKKKKK
ncbi:hypothetical protein [Pontibacter litorisediminis]|uniref:hypothetical protein n=1 Tax=Pontibacter litorisediminis TaxID=1846260 RepID=UPI0023ED1141|nr:hypothetical protein [Pontibacter litorisediminis]